MKRKCWLVALFCILFCGMSLADEGMPASIPVENAGQADSVIVMEDSEGNVQELKVEAGKTGSFEIMVTDTGVWSYTLYEKDTGIKGVTYDKTVYQADVYGAYDEGWVFFTDVVLHRPGEDSKTAVCRFENKSNTVIETQPVPGGSVTNPEKPADPANPGTMTNVSTGVDSNAARLVFIIMCLPGVAILMFAFWRALVLWGKYQEKE